MVRHCSQPGVLLGRRQLPANPMFGEGEGKGMICCTIVLLQVQNSSWIFGWCGAGLPHQAAALGS